MFVVVQEKYSSFCFMFYFNLSETAITVGVNVVYTEKHHSALSILKLILYKRNWTCWKQGEKEMYSTEMIFFWNLNYFQSNPK